MPQLGLAKKEIRGFLGVNLRNERMDLADEELAKAINADLHSQLGTVVLRLGRTKQFTTALTNLAIRRLAKINSRRYQIASLEMYRDQVSILAGLSANLMTTLLPFRPLNDSTLWTFIADDALMRKSNATESRLTTIAEATEKVTNTIIGAVAQAVALAIETQNVADAIAKNVRIWGIVAPTVKPTIALGGNGQLSGTYTAVYTYVRKDGISIAHESNPSPTSDQIVPASGEIVITAILPTDPQVTHIRYYRTVASGAIHLFEVELSLESINFGFTQSWEAAEIVAAGERQFTQTTDESGTAVCFQWEQDHVNGKTPLDTASNQVATNPLANGFIAILDKTDAALGTAVETDNDPPPNASWAEEFQEHVFICRDSANPHYLWFSKRFRPESVPTGNFIEIGNFSDPLQCAIKIAGMLGVFSRITKYRISGNDVSGFVHTEALSRRGTRSPLAALATEFGIIFPSSDGVYLTNLITQDQPISDDIFRLFIGETVNGMSPVNQDQAVKMAAAVYKNRYYLSYPSGNSENPDTIAVYSRDTKKWYFYDHPMRSLFVEEDVDDLAGGAMDGFVYILEDGSTDGGSNINLDVETKDYAGENSQQRKLFRYIRPDIDTLGETVSIEMYVDGNLKRTASVNSARSKPLIPFPDGSMGYQWRARLRYTGNQRIRLYGIEGFWLPMGSA